MTPEGVVKARVKKILDAFASPPAYYFMPATGGLGRSGVPDFVGCIDGRFFAIECKAGKGKTTALQDRELRLIREAHGIALVINQDNVGLLKEALTNGESK